MQSVLRALRPHDRFNIVAFAEAARVWREDGPVPATAPHVRSAARYVESLEADGCEYCHNRVPASPRSSRYRPLAPQGPTSTARCWRRPPSSAAAPRSPACRCCSS